MAHLFLEVKNFAQIREARIEFGDLTVLVGAQATGKSLLLQLLKLVLDGPSISTMMTDAGLTWKSTPDFIARYLGEGMESAWRASTSIRSHMGVLDPKHLPRKRTVRPDEHLFYVPAQRALLLVDGWPLRFERLTEATPFVARLFSDALFRLLASRAAPQLFPAKHRLKEPFRVMINDALYHDGRVNLAQHGSTSRRLELVYGEQATGIPFQTWTAGQREFTPLLLGLYRVVPAGPVTKADPIDWVVIEEPEMGLHPRGIEVVMLLVLELLRRRYRVVLSTHSPVVLEVIWGIKRLAEHHATGADLLDVFQVRKRHDLVPVADRALKATYRAFALSYQGPFVTAEDISDLDPASSSPVEAFWGGLTELGARITDAVTRVAS